LLSYYLHYSFRLFSLLLLRFHYALLFSLLYYFAIIIDISYDIAIWPSSSRYFAIIATFFITLLSFHYIVIDISHYIIDYAIFIAIIIDCSLRLLFLRHAIADVSLLPFLRFSPLMIISSSSIYLIHIIINLLILIILILRCCIFDGYWPACCLPHYADITLIATQ